MQLSLRQSTITIGGQPDFPLRALDVKMGQQCRPHGAADSGFVNGELLSVGPVTASVMSPNPSSIDWPLPWHLILEGKVDDRTATELYSEVGKQHVLYGIKVRPVARRQDSDDVLFQLLDDSGRFAIVHLTYAQHPEADPQWPGTDLYSDWAAFETNRLQPDAEEWAR